MLTRTRQGIGIESSTDAEPARAEGRAEAAADELGAAATFELRVDDDATVPGHRGRGAAVDGALDQGAVIGRFVILGVLGAGGMGRVYSAYDPQLDRKVAIKLLRASVRGAADARTRLLREAQAMAKINHPNVVKVHEVGTYTDQVYVAMEFVDAGTLREYLAGEHTQREIMDVMVQAGRGLAAAHAAGLVHRDFKPDNVLLAKDGSVRVTDFGIVGVAAPHENLRDPTAPPRELPDLAGTGETPLSQSLTRTGTVMGTPRYMAPEQFNGLPASARADVFAFCVVLHEALYGVRPFAGETFHEIGTNVLAGALVPPPREARVPGWLRRIVLRGLAVQPSARYASMEELLAELTRDRGRRRRILAWAGIAAGVAVGVATAAVATVLVLRPGAGATCDAGGDRVAAVWSPARRDQVAAAFRASGRPHAAASADKLAHLFDGWARSWEAGYRDACEATHVRGEQSAHLLDLRMQCLTRRLDETGATITLLAAGGGDAVDHAIEAALALPPVTACSDAAALTAAVAPPETEVLQLQVGALRARLDEARGLERLGQYAAALAIARPALAVAQRTAYPPAQAEALLVTGRLKAALGDLSGIDTLRESMYAAATAGDSALMLDAAAQLVSAITTQGGRYEAAQEIAGLADAVASHARPGPEAAVYLQNAIGQLAATRGRPAEARARHERALAIAERELGPDHLATLHALTQLGSQLQIEGQYAEARRVFERVLAARERVSGKDHPDVAGVLHYLAGAYREEGKLDDAQRVEERALAIRVAALGPDHPAVGASHTGLGSVAYDRQDLAAAERHYRKALALWERAYGPADARIAGVLANLATVLGERGEQAAAAQLFERVILIAEAAYGPDHPKVAQPLMNLGILRQAQHRLDDALALFQRSARIFERTYGPDHPDVADALGNVSTVLRAQHKLDEARAMLVRSLRIAEKVYGTEHQRYAMGLVNLGDLQVDQGDHADALESYRRSTEIFEARLGKEHIFLSYSLLGAARALAALRRPDEASPLAQRARQIRAAAGGAPLLMAEVHEVLAEILVLTPGARARAITEAKAALAGYEQAGDADSAAKLRRWLAQHR